MSRSKRTPRERAIMKAIRRRSRQWATLDRYIARRRAKIEAEYQSAHRAAEALE